MVDKCPNCGQPSRSGARFCTSCGFRLPERPVEPEPSPLSRSPFATTSTVAASWWPSASPTESTDSKPTADQSDLAASETPAAAVPPTLGIDEPVVAAADAASGAESQPTQAEPVIEAPAPESAPSEPTPVMDWPTFPSFGSDNTGSTFTWPNEVASTDPTPSSASSGLAEAVEAMAGDSVAEDLADVQADDVIELPAPSAEPERASWYSRSDDDDHDAPPAFSFDPPVDAPPPTPWTAPASAPAVASAPSAEPVSSDSLTRAQSLIDELSELLPSLAGPASPAATEPAVDLSEVTAGLTAARDDSSGDQANFDALMAVVDTARSRPRDIDVMLDLARHVEAIAALKAAHDRYRDAVDTALSQLQNA